MFYSLVMHKLILTTIVVVFLAACGRAPTATELASKYLANPDAFERLAAFIKVDAGKKECFEVGLDKIDEYFEHRGEWTNRFTNDKQALSGVLKAVGLSQSRYSEYKKLFASTGSERVGFCQTERTGGPLVHVLVYRSGFAMAGCIASIDWRNGPPISVGKHSNESEITLLRNGWFLHYKCS